MAFILNYFSFSGSIGDYHNHHSSRTPVGLVGNREIAAEAADGLKPWAAVLSTAFERYDAGCAGFRQIDRTSMGQDNRPRHIASMN